MVKSRLQRRLWLFFALIFIGCFRISIASPQRSVVQIWQSQGLQKAILQTPSGSQKAGKPRSARARRSTTSGGCDGPWSMNHQEPISCVPYPDSMFSKKLPRAGNGGPLDHLARNSDLIAVTALTNDGRIPLYARGRSEAIGQAPIVGDLVQDEQVAKYYGNATDPAFVITSCTHHATSTTNGHTNNPIGFAFHAPAGVRFPRCLSDKFILVWDQTQQKLIQAYGGGPEAAAFTFPPCSSTNLAHPCPVALPDDQWCAMDDFYDSQAYGIQPPPGNTNRTAPGVGLIRVQELMQGHINHVLYLNTNCTMGEPVFPDTVSHGTAMLCSTARLSTANRPPNGSLVFLDYTTAQLADLKLKLPAWQYPVIEAMTLFGGYLGDTGASGISPQRFEDSIGYKVAGLSDPIFKWIAPQAHSNCNHDLTKCITQWFANVPNESGTDITHHIHIAHPCVAIAQAGLSSWDGIAACP